MSTEEPDPVAQLKLLGIGLIIGGLLFAALTVALDVLTAGPILLGVGLVVWMVEYLSERTVGIGVGIAVAGVTALIEHTYMGELAPLETAGFLVAGGVADYLLAPAYVKLQQFGEEAGS